MCIRDRLCGYSHAFSSLLYSEYCPLVFFCLDVYKRQDLLGVLADRNVAVADGKQHITALQLFREVVKALDVLRVAFRYSQRYLCLLYTSPTDRSVRAQP